MSTFFKIVPFWSTISKARSIFGIPASSIFIILSGSLPVAEEGFSLKLPSIERIRRGVIASLYQS